MELKIGIDKRTGLQVVRQLDYFTAGIIEPKITIIYREWFLSPTEVRLEPTLEKRLFIVDVKEVLSEDEETILAPANLAYTNWKEKMITLDMVGHLLGDDIIIASINKILQSLPIE